MLASVQPILDAAAASKRVFRHGVDAGVNRVELLALELQEERLRLMSALRLIVACAVLAILAGVALTLGIAWATMPWSPLVGLGILAILYALGAVWCYVLLLRLERDWRVFSATVEELRKDFECLKETLH